MRAAAPLLGLTLLFSASAAQAGAIFLTGHDPDFHVQLGSGPAHAGALLAAGLNFVTGGTYDDGNNAATKFLWVESRPTIVPGGHLRGEAGLTGIGLTLGVDYDRVNAAELASVNFSDYTAIAVASSFGGLLSRAELDGLIAREADIAAFINAGGGLFAASECYPCGADLLGGPTPPELFGYLPVSVTSIGAAGPFTVTAAGAAAPFNLSNDDVNDPTHNSFGLVGGLTVLDRDQNGNATTLAGIVQVTQTGLVPEPGSVALLGLGLAALGARRRKAG